MVDEKQPSKERSDSDGIGDRGGVESAKAVSSAVDIVGETSSGTADAPPVLGEIIGPEELSGRVPGQVTRTPAVKQRNIDRIRQLADSATRRSLRILATAMRAADKEPEKVAADASLPYSDAPWYLHASLRMATAMAKPQDDTKGGTTNNLNVVIAPQAPTMASWLAQAKQLTDEAEKNKAD